MTTIEIRYFFGLIVTLIITSFVPNQSRAFFHSPSTLMAVWPDPQNPPAPLMDSFSPVIVPLYPLWPLGSQAPVDQWLSDEVVFSVERIFRNISPVDAKPGAVIAAQTRVNPNYYYHWVRDAALTAEALIDRYNFNLMTLNGESNEQVTLLKKLKEYFEFSEAIQNVATLEGLGEPKYHVDGSAYNEPWGRPQNDGPALRALSLIHWAQILKRNGSFETFKSRLYNGRMVNGGVIKRDLEYVSNQWRHSSFDLWEEVRGDHFYTRMVQRRAMVEGAQFADLMGDSGAAQWYRRQALEIEKSLWSFWDDKRGYIVATLNVTGGLDYKYSQLDTAVILALLHGGMNDNVFSFTDARVQATLYRIEKSFKDIYQINTNPLLPGTAIGRYPEDKYGGSHFNAGNPWILCTLALAEAYYRMAAEYNQQGNLNQAAQVRNKADSFVQRVQFHAHSDGSLNEQYDRNSGYMTSVEDLTWNYGSVLTTAMARYLSFR